VIVKRHYAKKGSRIKSIPTVIFCLLLLCFCSARLAAQTLGYAFSGGGARGFAHIGVLKVLEEEGLKPNYISGSSIGAIIGALYAMGYTPSEIEQLCLGMNWDDLTRDLHQRKELYIGQKRWLPYGNVEFELNDSWMPQLPSSVFVGNRINLELFRITAAASQTRDFSALPISFVCNATNLISGKPHVFTEGSLMQALRASMSIPSLVKPFEINGDIYIDGGVSQNLPIDLLHQMGAQKVVGIKVNSTLRNRNNLNNLVEILDQTINIGITRNLQEHLDNCDLLLEPDLSGFSSTDYQKLQEIIDAGEKAAREQIGQIRELKSRIGDPLPGPTTDFDKHLSHFKIAEINVTGNRFISAVKVREYLGLKTNSHYSTEELLAACTYAWNSQVFNTIYPELIPRPDGSYDLEIHVKEKDRKTLALNMSYNSDEKLNAGLVLALNNYLLKNSKLISELKLGGKNELNLDYVKNFGEQWGAYYRLFGYVNEKTIYDYVDHHRVSSARSLDWGFTTGLGIFAKDILIGELFLYGGETSLYSEISSSLSIPKSSLNSGFGVKTYHESLDDYLFPSKGLRICTKFNFARSMELSDYIYSSFRGRGELYIPLWKSISYSIGTDYGSYFNSDTHDELDPYIIGGMEGFLGYSRYEVSAPHYQILSSSLSYLAYKYLWFSLGAQALRYADSDVWGVHKDWEFCSFAGLGIKSKLLPAKLILALNEAGKVNSLLSIGYDLDIFSFSRK